MEKVLLKKMSLLFVLIMYSFFFSLQTFANPYLIQIRDNITKS